MAFLIIGIIITIWFVVKMLSLRGNNDHGTKFICYLALTSIDGALKRRDL